MLKVVAVTNVAGDVPSTMPEASKLVAVAAAKVCVAVHVWARLSSASVPVLPGNVAVNAEAEDAGARVTLPVAVELARVRLPLDEPAVPSVTAFGRASVQVPVVVMVQVPDAVIWLVVPAIITDVTVPNPAVA